jgi:hypothetical protein
MNGQNGFKEHGLNEDDFAPKAGSIVSSFDAFRESTYLKIAMTALLVWLSLEDGGPC